MEGLGVMSGAPGVTWWKKFKLRSNLLSCCPLTQGAFSKLPYLSQWERVAEGEVLRRLHAVAETGRGVSLQRRRNARRSEVARYYRVKDEKASNVTLQSTH